MHSIKRSVEKKMSHVNLKIKGCVFFFVFSKKMSSAKTIVYMGPMFSGKTKRILADVEKAIIGGLIVKLIKHASDKRYGRGNMISSHDGSSMNCTIVENLETIPDGFGKDESIDMIVIDEGQFITGVAAFCKQQNEWGREVRVAGLNSYANKDRTPWPEMIPFMGFARIVSTEAICVSCHKDAYCSRKLEQQTISSEGVTEVGSDDKYVATCEACYTLPLNVEKLHRRRNAIETIRKLKISI